MRVLIVCSGNTPDGSPFEIELQQPFIYEQVTSLKNLGIEFDFFFIKGKGLYGYLKHIRSLRGASISKYDIIHAHNGLCGLVSSIQQQIPVVTTYHGSDINFPLLRMISYFSMFRSSHNILVSQSQHKKVPFRRSISVIACGIDTHIFMPMDKKLAINLSNMGNMKRYILFSSSYSNKVKNAGLAVKALDKLNLKDIELIELKNMSRNQVCLLLNCSELLIMTSYSEGSPQIIKEAMACNCPIVSTDVGDVRDLISGIEGCFITTYDPNDVADKVQRALEFSKLKGRTYGRERILQKELDVHSVALKIYNIYRRVLHH